MRHITDDEMLSIQTHDPFDEGIAHIEACPTCAERARTAMWKWVGKDIHNRLPGTMEPWDGTGCLPPSHIWWIGYGYRLPGRNQLLEEPMHADHLKDCPKCRWCVEVATAHFTGCFRGL